MSDVNICTTTPGQSPTYARRNHEVIVSLAICRLLATRAMTLQELADTIGYSQRATRRYIYALRQAGLDIVAGHHMGHFPDDAYNDIEGLTAFNRITRTQETVYRLDPRSWAGLLYLPDDGPEHTQSTAALGGAR